MNKSGRSFNYQPRPKEALKERANMRGGNFDDIIKPQFKKFKVHDGKNLIRILPPTWDEARHYGYDIYVNYGIGADNQSYLSLSKMKNDKDPIAEAQRMAAKEGDEKLARELQPRQRILMWVIDRNGEDEGPLLWAAPFTFDKALANVSFDEDTGEVIFIDDPEQGCDVRFYKEGTGLKTNYDASKMRLMKPSPIHQDEKLQDQWLEYVQQNPIPDCLQFYDYAHINNVFNGGVGGQEKDLSPGEDERPQKRNMAINGARNARADDETPAETTPTRRRPTVTKPDPEDDDQPVRRRATTTTVDEEPPFDGGSIRDRIRRRQEAAKAEVEDD